MGFPGSSAGQESNCNAGDASWVGKTPWRRDRLPTPVFLGFPAGSDGKESAQSRPGFDPWVGRSPGGGHDNPLQYSCLENRMDGGDCWAAVHGVVKSRTRLSNFTFTFHFPALEKEMATHSSVLAWRIPGPGEPSGLPSMGSHRVGHN